MRERERNSQVYNELQMTRRAGLAETVAKVMNRADNSASSLSLVLYYIDCCWSHLEGRPNYVEHTLMDDDDRLQTAQSFSNHEEREGKEKNHRTIQPT